MPKEQVRVVDQFVRGVKIRKRTSSLRFFNLETRVTFSLRFDVFFDLVEAHQPLGPEVLELVNNVPEHPFLEQVFDNLLVFIL